MSIEIFCDICGEEIEDGENDSFYKEISEVKKDSFKKEKGREKDVLTDVECSFILSNSGTDSLDICSECWFDFQNKIRNAMFDLIDRVEMETFSLFEDYE